MLRITRTDPLLGWAVDLYDADRRAAVEVADFIENARGLEGRYDLVVGRDTLAAILCEVRQRAANSGDAQLISKLSQASGVDATVIRRRPMNQKATSHDRRSE